MPENFETELQSTFDLLRGKKLLVAVSGGIDSMVLTDVLLKQKMDISLAHCNFKLRENESSDDQHFVEHFAQSRDFQLFVASFDTSQFAQDFHLSVQMAARELRYNWFKELAGTHGFDYILTAHHADDNLETFLINLSRATGIDGLTGIPRQNGKVLRPLLGISRSRIEAYAKTHGLSWREDSSNASDKYLRNQIRLKVVPVLKSLQPDWLHAFEKTQQHLRQTQAMAEDAAVLVYRQVAQQANDEIHFNLDKLLRLPNYNSYLYHWLREFGFTAWDDIASLVGSESGKQVLAPNHRLIKNRGFLILSPLYPDRNVESYEISINQKDVNVPIKLSISSAGSVSDATNNVIFVDAGKLEFPMTLRKWQAGDVFQPYGMGGRSKKVSKFFKDAHLSLTDKEKIWLLCAGQKIVWIVGYRADDRFKVDPTTSQILKITLTP